ncbi:MAG: cupin domain-containing protein [bacterium]
MNIYRGDIKELALENTDFRRVLYTGNNAQIVVMCLKPGEDIGEEVHDLDQILTFIEGTGKSVLDDKEYEIRQDLVFYVPKGTKHNFINTGSGHMKLYTIYSPAQHRDGTIHVTKQDAMMDDEDHA